MSDGMRGGIGGFGAAVEDHQNEGVVLPGPHEETRAAPQEPRPMQADESLRQAHESIAELRTAIIQLRDAVFDRLDGLDQAVTQLQGQLAQGDLALRHFDGAIRTLDERMTALRGQVARNMRLAVLELAVKAKGPADGGKQVRGFAREFLEFVEPTEPAAENSQETTFAASEPGARTH